MLDINVVKVENRLVKVKTRLYKRCIGNSFWFLRKMFPMKHLRCELHKTKDPLTTVYDIEKQPYR